MNLKKSNNYNRILLKLKEPKFSVLFQFYFISQFLRIVQQIILTLGAFYSCLFRKQVLAEIYNIAHNHLLRLHILNIRF